jgi:hypothetical protein
MDESQVAHGTMALAWLAFTAVTAVILCIIVFNQGTP